MSGSPMRIGAWGSAEDLLAEDIEATYSG